MTTVRKGSRGCRAKMTHIRQSKPDSGLGFQVKVLKPFEGVPSSLGNGASGEGRGGSGSNLGGYSIHGLGSGVENCAPAKREQLPKKSGLSRESHKANIRP